MLQTFSLPLFLFSCILIVFHFHCFQNYIYPFNIGMKNLIAFIGYLPDIMSPWRCGISPLKGMALLNLSTSESSAIAISIYFPLMKSPIYIKCFFDVDKLSPLTIASSFFDGFALAFGFSMGETSKFSAFCCTGLSLFVS